MLTIGQQPEKPLQRAIEQGGVKQIRVEIFTDGRGIEVGNGVVRAGDFNMRHGLETAPVIESGEVRVAIEALAFDPALCRHAAGRRNDCRGNP